MTKILFAICLLLSGISFAQPTITGATNNPIAGDKFHIRGCDTAGVTAGTSGPGATWNFSSLLTVYSDSIEFFACSATPYCDSFPGATLAVTFDGSYFDYLITDTSQFASLGSYDGLDMFRFDDPYAISVYPMTYGSVKVDTVAQHFDTTFYAWAVDSFIADGYGTLILPSGTYDSVLRVHIVATEKDSFLSSGSYVVEWYRTESYYWYRPGFRFILLSQYYDTSGSGTPHLLDLWYSPFPPPAMPSTVVDHKTGTRFFTYPNPVSDACMIEIRSNSRQSALIRIADVKGNTVVPQQVHELAAGTNNIAMKTSHLPPGVYYIQVITSDGNYSRKIQVER